MLPLIGLAHGSRDPRASSGIEELLAEVSRRRPGLPTVAAYLDLTAPDLTAALTALAAPEVVVLPLLFSQAFHAGIDSPEAIRAASAATGTRVRRAGILGMGDEVIAALQLRAVEAGIADVDAVVLAAVGSSSATANAAVADLAGRWSAERSGPVRAAFATAGEPKVAAVLAALAGPDRRVGVVPLFVAPGLLLEVIARQAVGYDAPVAAPLGTELAALVLQRYDEVATAGR
jgi:sirohydrochlorin cobaltochelatase